MWDTSHCSILHHKPPHIGFTLDAYKRQEIASHNIIRPCGSFPRPWNMSIIFCGALNKVRSLFAIHMFRLTLENLGGVILMALFIGNIVYPDIVH